MDMFNVYGECDNYKKFLFKNGTRKIFPRVFINFSLAIQAALSLTLQLGLKVVPQFVLYSLG